MKRASRIVLTAVATTGACTGAAVTSDRSPQPRRLRALPPAVVPARPPQPSRASCSARRGCCGHRSRRSTGRSRQNASAALPALPPRSRCRPGDGFRGTQPAATYVTPSTSRSLQHRHPPTRRRQRPPPRLPSRPRHRRRPFTPPPEQAAAPDTRPMTEVRRLTRVVRRPGGRCRAARSGRGCRLHRHHGLGVACIRPRRRRPPARQRPHLLHFQTTGVAKLRGTVKLTRLGRPSSRNTWQRYTPSSIA